MTTGSKLSSKLSIMASSPSTNTWITMQSLGSKCTDLLNQYLLTSIGSSNGIVPLFSLRHPYPLSTSCFLEINWSLIIWVWNSSWITCFPWSILIGRGFPSKSTRPQSHNLNVVKQNISISSVNVFFPAEWIVPPGIKTWSCFFIGKWFIHFSSSNSPVSCAVSKASTKSSSLTPSFVPK